MRGLVPSSVMELTIPEVLKEAKRLMGLNQAKFAEKMGVSQGTISKWLSQKQEPNTRQWNGVEKALRRDKRTRHLLSNSAGTPVPILSWVAAGKLAAPEGVRQADIEKILIIGDLPPGGDWIGLTVVGDSMDKIAPEGALIIVNRADKRLLEEKFYVFALPDGSATFKRYRAGPPPRLQPFSRNSDHETLYPGEDMLVVGRVRRVITDLG